MKTSHALVLAVASLTTVACSPAPQPQDAAAETGPHGTATSILTVQAQDALAPVPTASANTTLSAPATEPAKACTKIGCQSGLTIAIAWGKDTLSAGKYKVELSVDGKKGSCEVHWPYKSCSEPRVPQCSGDVKFALQTGCAAGGASAKDMLLGPIQLEGTPASASLKIWRDKVMVHQQELTPKYEELRPNGPGCEPVCQGGSLKVCVGTCTKAELDAAPTSALPRP
jgi:hypothetical protein